jgi:hypothetical protein
MLLDLDNQDNDKMAPCYSDWDADKGEDALEMEVSPTQLLSMAIKKRRTLFGRKERDFRKELLHTAMIQSLCKHLGESRASRRHHKRRRGRRSRSRSPKHAKCELDVQSDNDTIVSGSVVTAGAVDHALTDRIQFVSPMELDKAHVIQSSAPPLCSFSSDQCQAQNSNCYGGLDDPDPFGLDDLFTRMMSHHHQPTRNFEQSVRG